MGATLTPKQTRGITTVAELERHMRAAGLQPRTFRNAPGDTYAQHAHDDHKVLFCVMGAITFHTDGGDHEMSAGDRIDLEPGTQHSATVGGEGVVCTEAYADGPGAFSL